MREYTDAIKAMAYRTPPKKDRQGVVLDIEGLSEKYKQNKDFIKYLIRDGRNQIANYITKRIEADPEYDTAGLDWILPYIDRTYTDEDTYPESPENQQDLKKPLSSNKIHIAKRAIQEDDDCAPQNALKK